MGYLLIKNINYDYFKLEYNVKKKIYKMYYNHPYIKLNKLLIHLIKPVISLVDDNIFIRITDKYNLYDLQLQDKFIQAN